LPNQIEKKTKEKKASGTHLLQIQETKAKKDVSTKQEERKTHKGKGLVIRQRHTLFHLFVYI
jgi:hypothetical protein